MSKQKSRVLQLLHTHALWATIKRKLTKNDGCFDLDPEKQNKIMIKYYGFEKDFDCRYPKTFNETIAWMKINYRNELWYQCADKLGSKDFLKEHGLEQCVVKTYGVYSSSSEIDLDELPDDFVLKTNHDSGTVFVCHKGKTNFEEVFEKLDKAVKKTYFTRAGEWVYERIQPKIFAEELLKPASGNDLMDYKLHFYNGKFGWGYVAQNRAVDTKFTVFEGDYEPQDVGYMYLRAKQVPPKPPHFEEMIRLGVHLSKILDFVRVDFYETTKGLKIGELTFFTGSGGSKFTKKEYDLRYGKMFENCQMAALFPKKD